MKLISMTDFVLDRIKKPLGGQQVASVRHHELEKYRQIIRYADFLKQPLKLEMFVPCDDEGSYLPELPTLSESKIESDSPTRDYYIIYKDKIELYYKAKEKVLFEGFEMKDEVQCVNYDAQCIVYTYMFKYEKFTIEDLLNLHNGNLKLSESAIKQTLS
jgi:hypothetical protein